MKVVVHEIGPDRRRLFEGDAGAIEREVLFQYPWLRSSDPEHRGDLDALLEHLDSTQMYSVESADEDPTPEPDLAPGRVDLVPASGLVRAAEFLTGSLVALDVVRKNLWATDEDEAAAVLRAVGLPADAPHRAALAAAERMLDAPAASPPVLLPPTALVEAVVPEHGGDLAASIQRALAAGTVQPVHLGGKHSAGTMLARDAGAAWLLKPGAGGQSSASGAAEERASQAAREAAFYHAVKEWGLFSAFPRAEWLRIGGREYAALAFLSSDYRTVADLLQEDPNASRRLFDPHLRDGSLHQWAIAYYVLGETDGHGKNVMANARGRVQLIDHGSALAGDDFDPVHDQRTFVPYFLRAWAPPAFNSLDAEQKLGYLPRVPETVAGRVKEWLDGIWAPELEHVLLRYSVDPRPSLSRLARVKSLTETLPVDAAIDRLWVTT